MLNRAKRLPDGAHEPNYNTPRSVLGRVCPGRPRTDHVSDDLRQELNPTDRAVAGSQELDGTCPAGLVVVENLMERRRPLVMHFFRYMYSEA
jgi:hypothetical protein